MAWFVQLGANLSFFSHADFTDKSDRRDYAVFSVGIFSWAAMKASGWLSWCWIFPGAWLVLVGQAAPGEPIILPRAILSVQKTPPATVPPAADKKEDQPGMTIESKEDAEVLDLGLTTETMAVDLATVLRLGGLDNPQILLARERLVQTVAPRRISAPPTPPSLHLRSSRN